MKFQRTPTRRLPKGGISTVFPFHVSTKGEKVVFRTEDDLRVAFNLIPICALRANVIVVVPCVLNTHFHSVILARTYEDAKRFANGFKLSASMCITQKYGPGMEAFRDVESKPLLLEDDRHLRNAICYVLGNAMDTGATVDSYTWSGYSALFHGGIVNGYRVSEMTRREIREVLKADISLKDVPWTIDDDGIIEPASFCDWRYAESAFYGDVNYFAKVLGSVDRDQMDQEMIHDPSRKKSVEELLRDIEARSQRRYALPLSSLNPAQKIPILKAVNYSNNITVKLLARLFEMPEEKVSAILKRVK